MEKRQDKTRTANTWSSAVGNLVDNLGFGWALLLQTSLAVLVVVALTMGIAKLIKGDIDPDTVMIAVLAILLCAPLASGLMLRQHFRIRELDKRLQLLTTCDELTRVYNRRHFVGQVDQAIAEAEEQLTPLSLIMLDIDHFKSVNDQRGHMEGDQILRMYAQRAMASLRPADTMARLGGDEFVVLLPQTRLSDAQMVAERLRTIAMEIPLPVNQPSLKITISAGVAGYRHGEHKLDDFLGAADTALFEAKAGGRDQVRLYDPKVEPKAEIMAATGRG